MRNLFQTKAVEAPSAREREWLDDVFEQADTMGRACPLQPVLVLITPALAAVMLEHNTFNRTLRPAAVDTLATEMRAGRYIYTSLPILFDWNRVVADGQHRLQMCVETGESFYATISFGLDPAVRTIVDSHKPRSVADVLRLLYKVANANEVTAVAGYLWAWETRNEIPTNSTRKATRGQRMDFAEEQLERITRAVEAVPKNSVVSRSVLATMHAYLSKQTDPADVDKFIKVLIGGENLQPGDPVLTARNWLLSGKSKELKEPNKVFDLMIQTWNAWRRGDSMLKRPTLRGTLQAVES